MRFSTSIAALSDNTALVWFWFLSLPFKNKNVYILSLSADRDENNLSEVGFEPTPRRLDCDLNAAP